MMMYKLPLIGALALVLGSCASSGYFMADDAYVVKPSELPVGESTADETSYAAFKKRKTAETGERVTYQNQWDSQNSRRCLSEPFWYAGCGCSFNYWSMYSPFSSRNTMMAMSYGAYYNPYMPYSPYYSPYGYYGAYNMYHPYSSAFGIGLGYGYGWYGNGYGYNPYYYGYGNGGYGGGSVTHAQNAHSGPRGSVSGYANPNGRKFNPGSIKSATVHNTSTGGGHTNTATTVRKPVDNANAYRSPATTNSTVSRTSSGRTIVNRQSSEGTVNRTYENSTTTRPVGRQPVRINGNYNSGSRNSTIQNGSNNHSNSGSGTFNSGSSTRSGSSGSSSRSGSSGTNSGRRR